MYLTRNMKLVFLWALFRAYRHDAKGVFTTSYKEAMEETKIHRNTLAGIFKRLMVLDAFTFEQNEDQTFTINMSDYKEFTAMTMPMVDTVLSMRQKRRKNPRILCNNVKNYKKVKVLLKDGKSMEALEALEASMDAMEAVSNANALPSSGVAKKRSAPTSAKNKIPDHRDTVATNVLSLLTDLCGHTWSHSTSNKKPIKHILNQGFTELDLHTVVEYKCEEWKDTRYSEYLRPSTLFGDNFESYLHTARQGAEETAPPKGLWL